MINKHSTSATASGGAISFNTQDIRGICYRVFIKPATETTTYDVTFTDDNSLVVYSQKGARGTLNDVTTQTLRGIYTVAIANASVNELFKFQIEYDEVPS